MSVCRLNNVELFYAEKGQGEPLLFLNGLSGDHLYWMGHLRTFGKQYRALAIDQRDVGQSSYVTHSYTIREMAADAAELLRHLRATPAHVVGLSMGGMVAQELALTAPGLVKSLVLVSTAPQCDAWFCGTLNAFELIRRQVPDTAAFFEAILPWWVSHRFFEQSERVTWLSWLLRHTPHIQRLDGFLRQLEAIRHHDTLERLSQIRCPTLILVGEDDKVCPPRFSWQLRECMPHAELEILPGVGHAPPIEDPQAFKRHLSAFLSSQSMPLSKTG